MKTGLRWVVATAIWWAGQSGLAAQGCAMCKSSIAAQSEAVVASINAGILILLVPPLLIMSTILYVATRYRE